MNCDECKERSIELLEQKIPFEQDVAMQEHTRHCEECRRFAGDLQKTGQLLAHSTGSLQLRDGFVEDVMEQAKAMRDAAAGGKPLTIAPWLWLAAAALLAVLAMNAFELKFGKRERELQSANNAAEDEKPLPSGKIRLPANIDFTKEEKTVYEQLSKAEFPRLSCKDMPVAEVFALIAEKTGVTMVLSDSIREDEPSHINLELHYPVNGYALLEIVKKQSRLRSYVIYDDSIFIRHSYEYDDDEFYDVFYDLEPVVQAIAQRYPDATDEAAADSIQELVYTFSGDNDVWNNNENAQSVTRGNLLIVKQTRDTHREIIRLLRFLSAEPQGFVMTDEEAKQYAEVEQTKVNVPLLEQIAPLDFCALLQERLKRDVVFVGYGDCEGITMEACKATIPTILALAEPALDFYMEEGRLFICLQNSNSTGAGRLAAYPLSDIIENNISSEEVVELILSLVERSYWENSSHASISVEWNTMLVNAPPRVHAKIYDMLGKLNNPINPLAEDLKNRDK